MSELRSQTLARYADARIPRYTSYPAAPHFSADFGVAEYRSWLSSLPVVEASLYLHVPFCRAMCWYCGCHTSVTARDAPIGRYVNCLINEIGMVAGQVPAPPAVSHVHFGGGTPTLMTAEQMHRLMGELRIRFEILPGAEIAIEIDPRTLAPDMAVALGQCGFNRASIGVQSFDPAVQAAINRVQSFEQTAAAVQWLRDNGISRINFDLIYGLPLQSVQSCLETVDLALRLDPARLAVFGYAHVPSMKPHQRKIDAAALPDGSERFDQSQAIAEALVEAGYVRIGLDHFARPDDPMAAAAADGTLRRNFQGYTTDQAEVLFGFGASAIGRMPDGFVQNAVSIPEYQRRIDGGDLAAVRGYRFASEDRLRGRLIERLMCDYRVDVGKLCRSFGADPAALIASADLDRFVDDGMIDRDGEQITIRPHAYPLVRSVAAAFDAHLSLAPDRYSRAV